MPRDHQGIPAPGRVAMGSPTFCQSVSSYLGVGSEARPPPIRSIRRDQLSLHAVGHRWNDSLSSQLANVRVPPARQDLSARSRSRASAPDRRAGAVRKQETGGRTPVARPLPHPVAIQGSGRRVEEMTVRTNDHPSTGFRYSIVPCPVNTETACWKRLVDSEPRTPTRLK